MAAPPLTVGTRVQYNATVDSPLAKVPGLDESGVGVIRQAFFDQNECYYQVVWNLAGSMPKVGLYHANELTALNPNANQPSTTTGVTTSYA